MLSTRSLEAIIIINISTYNETTKVVEWVGLTCEQTSTCPWKMSWWDRLEEHDVTTFQWRNTVIVTTVEEETLNYVNAGFLIRRCVLLWATTTVTRCIKMYQEGDNFIDSYWFLRSMLFGRWTLRGTETLFSTETIHRSLDLLTVDKSGICLWGDDG